MTIPAETKQATETIPTFARENQIAEPNDTTASSLSNPNSDDATGDRLVTVASLPLQVVEEEADSEIWYLNINDEFDTGNFLCIQLPPELEQKGLRQEDWTTWMTKLNEVHQLKWSKTRKELSCALVLMVWFLVVPLSILLRKEGNTNRRWSESLFKWQNDFNEQCLQQHGMYCKTQSYGAQERCGCASVGDGFYNRFIVFAINPQDIEKLKREPHIFGDAADYSCCGHVPESELCMHPEYHIEWF